MRVVIIGGVAAGMSAAAKLKRIKPEYEVVVYEKNCFKICNHKKL
ncbi:coenzyme A disulfide reductase [Clostridioides difficile]|nr:coenzyme A disulfide reductase [Clostridioides difficile]